MAIRYPYSVRSVLPRFRTTSPGEDLWLALRDMYVLSGKHAYPTIELLDLPRWLEPPGPHAEHHVDVAITTTLYRLLKSAKRAQRRAALDGNTLREPAGQSLVEGDVWTYMVEHMEFSALDPTPRRVVPHLVYRSLIETNKDIAPRNRSITLDEANDDAGIRCYCCGDVLWTPEFETPRRDISLDHIWPRTLGGVSTPDNLLPICEPCNGTKQDRASWSVYGVVYDHAMVERGGEEENRMVGLALHRRAAGLLAVEKFLTLKEAYIRLGSRVVVEPIDEAGDDHFFNLRAHDVKRF